MIDDLHDSFPPIIHYRYCYLEGAYQAFERKEYHHHDNTSLDGIPR